MSHPLSESTPASLTHARRAKWGRGAGGGDVVQAIFPKMPILRIPFLKNVMFSTAHSHLYQPNLIDILAYTPYNGALCPQRGDLKGHMDSLKAALLGRSGSKKPLKSEVTDNLCHKLLTLFVWSPAPFFMEAAPNVMVVSLSALKCHIGGRVTLDDLKAALQKLVRWAPIETFRESHGVAVIKFRQPRMFREAVTSGLTPYTLLGLPKTKARLIDAAVSRMTKEMK